MREYDREKAVKYAHRWAYSRNPEYYDFEKLGGDCTNFISQCIYAGCKIMNNQKTFGWYYYSLNNRAPAWTGAEYLYNFLSKNTESGPYGSECALSEAQTGDIIQFSFDAQSFTHSSIIVKKGKTLADTLVAAHSFDTDNKAVYSYQYKKYRIIHITAARE